MTLQISFGIEIRFNIRQNLRPLWVLKQIIDKHCFLPHKNSFERTINMPRLLDLNSSEGYYKLLCFRVTKIKNLHLGLLTVLMPLGIL